MAVVFILLFSAVIIPFSPLSPIGTAHATTSSTNTVTISGTPVSDSINISISSPTYFNEASWEVAYFNVTTSYTVDSGMTLYISFNGMMGYYSTKLYYNLGWVNVTFFIGTNSQTIGHEYNYVATGGDEYFDFSGSTTSSYSGALSISIKETAYSGTWEGSPPLDVYSEPGLSDAIVSSGYSHSSPINVVTGYNYAGVQASSSFSSQVPGSFSSFNIYWYNAQYSTTATYNGVNQTGTSGSFAGVSGVYSISFAAPSGSNYQVSSYTVQYDEVFNVPYSATFTETGLPSGTKWYLNISGQSSLSSTTDSISISLLNGSYSYTIATGDKIYEPSPSSGSFTINNAAYSQSVTFTELTYSVAFSETGLTSGTWWVNVTTTGQSFSEPYSTTSMSFPEPNGTYDFTVQTNYKVDKPSISSSSFTVNGAQVSESVTFSEVVYPVTFKESGLSSGNWYVNITGQSPSGAMAYTTTTFSTSLPNGTYSYTIATGNKMYKPTPSSGSFTVNGASSSISTSFSLVEYEITVSESGLPSGNWYFNISTTSQDFTEPYSNTTLHFNETNGTYSFTVQTNDKEYSPSPSSGSLIINGSAQTLSVPFTEVTYSVTFTETGLPSGTKWYVNITSGPSYSSTATTITLPEDNGTHSYTIATGDKIYDPSPYSGSFTINGAGASESITFNEITYPVTFTETGLPSGTKWYVNITGGNSYSSTSTSLSFSAPNGTDSYTVATVNKIYYPTPSSSSFTVSGSSLSETVSFSEITYSVTFTETGLPSGTTWYVNLTGIGSYSSATSSLTFKDPNGTYDYTLSDNNNAYAPSPSSGSFTINGANLGVSVTFRTVKYNVTFKETGLPAGASWFAILNGSKTISNKTSISFLEFNGTYSYAVETPVNGSYGTRYVTVAPSKNVTVNGKAVTINITYSTQYYLLISISPSNGGTVSPSSEWVSASHYVIINASADQSFIFQSWVGTGSGSYSGPFNPENITVRGPINETAIFEKTYTITFTESGLPAGQKWYVNVSGPRSFYSYSTQISFTESNGSYSYSIGVNRIYSSPQETGTIVVQGSSITESVTFSLVTYTVDFIEIGLPSGDTWSVSLNGTLSPPSTNQSISFFMPNGTYPYSISPISGVVIEPVSGNVLVSGQNVVVNIVFSPQGNKGGVLVSFIETGLPTGKEWFVTLNGYVESSFSDLIQFYVQNGTYTYSISSSGGLKASPAFGNISVTHNMEVTVTFSNSTSSTTTVINPKVVEENLPLIIGSTVASIIAGWLLSIYINPENRKKRAEKKRGKRR
ncbi:MAG: hypothetical protein QW393_03715 [Candidatus Micrarchaeaceae archaeon]